MPITKDMSSSPKPSDRGSTGAAGVDNRRRSDRKPHVVDAWIWSPTATDPLEEREEVTSLNISRHGIAFTLAHPLPTGAFYVMEVSVGGHRMVSEVRIISCRRRESDTFDVGGEFC
jgi:hypothetical protein